MKQDSCCMCSQPTIAGYYCQRHLDAETADIDPEDLEAAADFFDREVQSEGRKP